MRRRTCILIALLAVPVFAFVLAGAYISAHIWGYELSLLDGGSSEVATGDVPEDPDIADEPKEPETTDEMEPLGTWTVDGDEITPVGDIDPQVERKGEKIWDRFVELVPADQRDMLVTFEIFEDESVAAAVSQDETDLDKWGLYANVDQANAADLEDTLVHEFGHLLTLNADQVPPDRNPPETEVAYKRKEATCAPHYYTGEGCAPNGAYIDEFVERFWPLEMRDAAERIASIEDESEWEEAVSDFADDHRGEFVSEYAASHPGEDIAESFAAFVLRPRPRGSSVRAEKIAFFWDYPELVELRSRIRSNL